MKLTKDFQMEIDALVNANATPEEENQFYKREEAVARALSKLRDWRNFNRIVKSRGRACVAICVALTIMQYNGNMTYRTVEWAKEVLKIWKKLPTKGILLRMLIYCNFHPSKICDYIDDFIQQTIVPNDTTITK